MCNLHWCYTFCTGVTLFALVLHLNCTALSQSESSNFFMCIIILLFKVPLWSNSRYPFFYIFQHKRSFLVILANFSLSRTLELMFFWTFISDSLRPPLIFLVPSLDWELEKMKSYSQKYHTGWTYNKQLLDEVEHDIMNYQSRGLCYLPKPKDNSSSETEAKRSAILFLRRTLQGA